MTDAPPPGPFPPGQPPSGSFPPGQPQPGAFPPPGPPGAFPPPGPAGVYLRPKAGGRRAGVLVAVVSVVLVIVCTVFGEVRTGMDLVDRVAAGGHDNAYGSQAGGGRPKTALTFQTVTVS